MSLQTCVERLFTLNSEYLHVEQAFNQASSLQTLSDDLYTDPCRYIYELIQNADDASSKHLQIALIDNNYLIVSYNGKIFDEKDVRSLCAVNNSTKIRDKQTAGYKGLGFKAIFGKSDYVLIINNSESFRFDANYDFLWTWKETDKKSWEHDNQRKFIYPWQICPIWTEDQQIPACIKAWLSNIKIKMPIHIIIRLHNVNETRKALEELIHQPHTFLFLRHIRHIEFSDKSKISTITIKQQQDGSISLSYDKNSRSEWLVSRREIIFPDKSPEILRDRRLPEKLRQIRSTEISLAARLDIENRKKFVPVPTTDSILFAYMPTKISTYNLPLLINGNFLTSANREQIHTDSAWNQWLFKSIPCVTMEWIAELTKKPNWNDAAYDLLPIRIKSNDILAKIYNENCATAFANTKFIRNSYGDNLSLTEAIIDSTLLSNQNFIGIESIRSFILHDYKPCPKPLPVHPFVAENLRLKELGIRTFEWKNAIDMFSSKEFQENFSIDREISLISYLFDKREDEEISKILHRIPFIMDRNKNLQIPTKIFFPSQFNDPTWNTPDCQEAYVHDDLMSRLSTQHRQWLEQLGVAIKTDLTFFYHNILPYASTFITHDNALPTIQRLFYLYINGQIIPDDLKKLGELSLITNAKTLVPANRLYLSSEYQPYLPLDNQLSTMPQLFLSPSYMKNIFCKEWKYFFLLLGVRENIDLVSLNNNYKSLIANYNEDQTRIIFNINSQQIHAYKYQQTIQFLELTEDNFHFAHFFWQYVIQKINIDLLNQSEIAYWGTPGRTGATRGSEVNTFPQWFVRTKSCIPVQILSTNGINNETKCLKGLNVFTNELSPLTGHYLPTFESTPNAEPLNDKWLKFFRFKTELSIDDHFYILHRIYVRNQIDDDDDERIQKIYGNLLKIFSKIEVNQRESYREKCQSKNIYFLNERNIFMPSEELFVWLIDNFQPPSEYHNILKLDRNNRRHKNLSDLLYVFNIHKIEEKDLNLKPINANSCDELTHRLQKSYFLLLFDYHKIKNKDKLNQLDNITYFEADRLELYTNDRDVFVGHTQIYNQNYCLYVTKSWNSNLILDRLSTKICELFDLSISSFKTHVYTLLTSPSINDYFIQLRIRSTDNNPSNDQFIDKIVQDNLKLFQPSYTPAELLLAGLEEQRPRWTGQIYHYTHLENAVSILRDQALKSRHQLQNNFKDSSAYDFMSEKDEHVNHYIRFYFRPRTLTQSDNENLGTNKSKKRNNYVPMCPVPIFFSIDLRAVLNIPNIQWKISLGDMSKNHTEYDCTLDVIKRFDFSGLFNELETERGQRSAQLEFLIENQLNFKDLSNDVITLIYQNSDAKESLEYMIERRNYTSQIRINYFFLKNNRIYINHDNEQDHIFVMIDRETHRLGEMLIVQIKSNDNDDKNIDLACKGNICAVFHHDHITTVYGKEKQLDVFVGKQNYAVYYKYQGQLWLIYTNHNKPEFDYSHLKQHPEFMLNE